MTARKTLEKISINPIMKILSIISKNMKLLMRSKISSLIFIFGPLIIITLLCLAFNTSTLYDLNIAVYSESYSELSDSIITDLGDNQYNLIKMNSEPDCIDAVKFGDFQVCLVFPADMSVTNTADNKIDIYVDNSRLNIANLIAGQINTKVSVESSQISADMVTEILGALNTANTEAVQTKSIIENLLSNNGEIKSSMDDLNTALTSINLSTSTLNTSAIDKELKNTAEDNGLNATEDFVDLTDMLDTFKADYTSMKTKLENTQNSITQSTNSITEISSNLDNEKSNLNNANSNMNTITSSVEKIAVTDVNNIVNPIKTSIEPLSSTNSYLLYILPTILVLLIMFTALLMSSSSIMAEKESRAYFRNFITPTNEFLFMIGEYLSNLIVLLFQVFIIMLVLYFFLSNILATEIFVLTGISLFFLGTFFIFLGMLFGYMLSTKQTVTLASISAGMVFLFFSNTILPLETLSSSIRNVVMYNPYIIGESMLKKVLLFNSTFQGISNFCYTLLIFSAVVLLLAVIVRYTSKGSINKD